MSSSGKIPKFPKLSCSGREEEKRCHEKRRVVILIHKRGDKTDLT
jgi:hypothetical protein